MVEISQHSLLNKIILDELRVTKRSFTNNIYALQRSENHQAPITNAVGYVATLELRYLLELEGASHSFMSASKY